MNSCFLEADEDEEQASRREAPDGTLDHCNKGLARPSFIRQSYRISSALLQVDALMALSSLLRAEGHKAKRGYGTGNENSETAH